MFTPIVRVVIGYGCQRKSGYGLMKAFGPFYGQRHLPVGYIQSTPRARFTFTITARLPFGINEISNLTDTGAKKKSNYSIPNSERFISFASFHKCSRA